jgi:protein tyrosine phosphatase (PTP) superfamily phosphohydrolase (DUF442 family)
MSIQAHKLRFLVALLGLAVSGCSSTPEGRTAPDWPELRAAELGSMHNVSVSNGLWIGGSPTEKDLDLAYRRGVRRVISLCTREEGLDYDLREVGARLGLEVHEVGPRDSDLLGEVCVDRSLALLGEGAGVKTLMFCQDGSRCAAIFAIHRVIQAGMPLEDALFEARRAGLRPADVDKVKRHVERLGPEAVSGR